MSTKILECNSAALATQNLDDEQRARSTRWARRRPRVRQIKTHFRSGTDLTSDERGLLLAALFHLRIDDAEDVEKGVRIAALVVKLGGDPEAVFFGG